MVCTVYVRGGGLYQVPGSSFDVRVKNGINVNMSRREPLPHSRLHLWGRREGIILTSCYNRSGSSGGVPVRPGWWCRACIWSTVHVCTVYVRGGGTYQVPGSPFDVRVKMCRFWCLVRFPLILGTDIFLVLFHR